MGTPTMDERAYGSASSMVGVSLAGTHGRQVKEKW